MQKKLIALAVAGLVSGGAFAQSNVTIYGIVDAGMEIGSAGFGSKTRIQSGQSAGNRIGFKGEEALGNGITAMFQLEAGFALDNGQFSNNSSQLSAGAGGSTNGAVGVANPNTNGVNTGSATGTPQTAAAPLFQRTAIAGLKGSWGQVTVGRQYAPEFLVTAAVDPFAAGLGGNNGVVLTGGAGFAQRLDNSVMYVSPNLSGFTLGIGYSSGSENNVNGTNTAGVSDKAGRTWGLLGTYANGPAYVGLGYHNVYGPGTFVAPQTDSTHARSWLGGASWNFGVVKLSGTYFTGKADAPGIAGNVADGRAYTIGLQAPMGPWTFNAVYGKRDDKTAADKDFSTFSIGGEYAMSKRTAFYAAYTKIDNRDRAALAGAGIDVNSALNTGLQVKDGNYDPNAVQFGMRHSF